MSMKRVASLLLAGVVGGTCAAVVGQVSPAGSDPKFSWSARVEPMNERLVDRFALTAGMPATIDVPKVTSAVAGHEAYPETPARAVLVNVTIVDPAGDGYVAAWADGDWPGTSQLNYTGDMDLLSNLMFVEVSDGSTFELLSSTDVEVVVDLVAAFPIVVSNPVP